jgi:hypothetical protein
MCNLGKQKRTSCAGKAPKILQNDVPFADDDHDSFNHVSPYLSVCCDHSCKYAFSVQHYQPLQLLSLASVSLKIKARQALQSCQYFI